MRPEIVESLLADPKLSEHREAMARLARPCVDLTASAGPARLDGSRFGGDALVPADFVWPEHEVGDYYFLGQLNFAELPDGAPESLPRTGLLSLFYAMDVDGEVFWQDEGYVLGYYWPTTDDLQPRPQPDNEALADGDIELPEEAMGLELAVGLDLPRHPELVAGWPGGDEVRDALHAALDEIPAPDHLLGWPVHHSLGYDPTPGPDWTPLLTVGSHEAMDWCWHDGDNLMVFIQTTRLAARDFTALRCDAG